MDHFSQAEIEALKFYVYCLVDPRNKYIFYVGKGQGNRVFEHTKNALINNEESLKLNKIREIISSGSNVDYYIIRHGIESEEEAYRIESAIIDLLTYPLFNTETLLTNISAGHHQWNEGIKSISEISELYNCEELVPQHGHALLLVNLNKTFNQRSAKCGYIRSSLYEATRKYWRLNKNRADNVDYILGVYKGIVRIVIKPTTKWRLAISSENGECFKSNRYEIEGDEKEPIGNKLYLNKEVKDYPFPYRGAIRYINS